MPSTECGFIDVPGGAAGAELLAYYGPTLKVDIGFDATFIPTNFPLSVPAPGVKGIHALVDTGASESCIDSMLASQLNLPIVDRRMVSGVHGSIEINMHLAQVHVPSLGFTIWGSFAGVNMQAGGQLHLALIGRTFLRGYTMMYDGRTGKVTIS